MVQSMGIDSYHCDGNNAMEVYNLTFNSIKKIRNKKIQFFLNLQLTDGVNIVDQILIITYHIEVKKNLVLEKNRSNKKF